MIGFTQKLKNYENDEPLRLGRRDYSLKITIFFYCLAKQFKFFLLLQGLFKVKPIFSAYGKTQKVINNNRR